MIILTMVLNVQGQTEQRIVPESPEAYAFTKHAKQPVDLHRGLPEISIPIYTITTKSGLSVPIALTYHSGGIKVNEHSTPVGIGWRLAAGGMVSRVVHGLPDLEGYPRQYPLDELHMIPGFEDIHTSLSAFNIWNNDDGIPCLETWTQEQVDDYQYALDVLGLTNPQGVPQPKSIDALADIYYYSSPSISGKFILDVDGMPQTIPYKPHKISKDPGLGGAFRIVDGSGNEFEYAVAATYFETPQQDAYSSFFEHWKLTRITTYDGEEVVFNYSTESHTYSNPTIPRDYAHNNVAGSYGCVLPQHNNIPIETQMNERRLEEVEFGTGRIQFIYSDSSGFELAGSSLRKDLEGATALRKVIVFNHLDQVVKEYSLEQSYFSALTPDESDPDRYRLKLDAVTESSKPPFQFSYFGDGFMPHRLSDDQDYWGYYRGQTNGLLPEARIGDVEMTGSDRSMSPDLVKTGSLKSVTYPTGGKTTFFFNESDYLSTQEETSYSTSSSPMYSSVGEHVISLPEDSNNTWKMVVQNDCGNVGGELEGILENGYCHFEVIDENDAIVTSKVESQVSYIQLDPSINYKVKIEGMPGQSCNCSVSFEGETALIEEVLKPIQLPGLRLDSVVTDPIDGIPMTTKYDYTDPFTGEISQPSVIPKFWYMMEKYTPDAQNVEKVCSFYARSGSPIKTTLYSGYKYVKVYQEGIGGTQYEFNVSVSGRQVEPILHLTFDSPIGGTPHCITTFDDSGRIQTKETHKYLLDNTLNDRSGDYMQQQPSLISMGIAFNHEGSYLVGNCINMDNPEENESALVHKVEWNFIGYPNNWVKKESEQHVSYYYKDSELQDSIVNRTQYHYDNDIHQQVTRVETTSSTGDTLVAKSYFPHDVVHPEMPLEGGIMSLAHLNNVDALKDQHRIDVPIQTESYKNGVKLGMNRTLYTMLQGDQINYGYRAPLFVQGYESGLIVPETILSAKADGELEPKTNISYDQFGFVSQTWPEGGTPTSFIWGYDHRLPVAKLDGIQISAISPEIISRIDSLSDLDVDNISEQVLIKALDSLRDLYPEAMVTTFTYDPLIGMTSATDSRGVSISYEYDQHHRLSATRDDQGHLISKYEYQYNPAIVQSYDPFEVDFASTTSTESSQWFQANLSGGSGDYNYQWYVSLSGFPDSYQALSDNPSQQVMIDCSEVLNVKLVASDNITGTIHEVIKPTSNECDTLPLDGEILLDNQAGNVFYFVSAYTGGLGNVTYEWFAGIGTDLSFHQTPSSVMPSFPLEIPCETSRWVKLRLTDSETDETIDINRNATNDATCSGSGNH